MSHLAAQRQRQRVKYVTNKKYYMIQGLTINVGRYTHSGLQAHSTRSSRPRVAQMDVAKFCALLTRYQNGGLTKASAT